MHELRRRFGINGSEDDMTAVNVDGGRVFVGLPAREGGLLGELLRGGEVGYELSLDPRSPVVVGLYPMRPVPRYLKEWCQAHHRSVRCLTLHRAVGPSVN